MSHQDSLALASPTHTVQPCATLHLTLKRRWFDAIASGRKRREYRDLSPYWVERLGPHVGRPPWTEIRFRNGYSHGCPVMRVECIGLTLGRHQDQPCYVLHLGRILELDWGDRA